MAPATANAHPHVFVKANLEIVRDGNGVVSELRHVWRFDELFSSEVLLDYDDNGDGALSVEELDEVSKTVTQSVGEYDFYTEVRVDGETRDLVPPDRIMVDYLDGEVVMFFALTVKEPVPATSKSFKIAVSDPTYYVAMEIADEAAVQVSGTGEGCKVTIDRPDFDKLYSQDPKTLTEQFFADPANEALGDQWLTWVNLQCK